MGAEMTRQSPVAGKAQADKAKASSILSLAQVSFSYNGPGREVLSDLSLDIPEQAVTAILGPNGSGKTTLLRLLLGVLRPHSGQVWVAGHPQTSYSRRELSQLVGLVPQDEHIPFEFSVLEYVLLGRTPYLGPLSMPGVEDRRIALQALSDIGLSELRHRLVPKLSGGERQLVLVARALAQNPRILLLDEPSAHLDLGNQGRLLSILSELLAHRRTVVLTTHDPNLAALVADHVVLMHRGQVLAAGPSRTVLTAEALSATYGLPVRVAEIEGRRVVLLPGLSQE
jgi:iron complex transport system ATP-binding protein